MTNDNCPSRDAILEQLDKLFHLCTDTWDGGLDRPDSRQIMDDVSSTLRVAYEQRTGGSTEAVAIPLEPIGFVLPDGRTIEYGKVYAFRRVRDAKWRIVRPSCWNKYEIGPTVEWGDQVDESTQRRHDVANHMWRETTELDDQDVRDLTALPPGSTPPPGSKAMVTNDWYWVRRKDEVATGSLVVTIRRFQPYQSNSQFEWGPRLPSPPWEAEFWSLGVGHTGMAAIHDILNANDISVSKGIVHALSELARKIQNLRASHEHPRLQDVAEIEQLRAQVEALNPLHDDADFQLAIDVQNESKSQATRWSIGPGEPLLEWEQLVPKLVARIRHVSGARATRERIVTAIAALVNWTRALSRMTSGGPFAIKNGGTGSSVHFECRNCGETLLGLERDHVCKTTRKPEA